MRKITQPAWFLLLLSFCLVPAAKPRATDGIVEVDLSVRSLAYDPLTEKLYASATNGLLQLDPGTGEVLQSFELGTNISRLKLGAGGGLWMGLDGEGAVQRFNLRTLEAEEKIVVQPGFAITDLSPSQSDPYTVAVVFPKKSAAQTYPRAHVIRNGAVLPQYWEHQRMGYIALHGAFIYAQLGPIYEAGVGPNGITAISGLTVPSPISPFTVHGGFIYHASGDVYDVTTLATVTNFNIPGDISGSSTIAINEQQGEVYFLGSGSDSWELNGFEHPSGQHVARMEFPKLEAEPYPRARDLAVWAPNRAAFHTATNVYLVQIPRLILGGDLEVLQSVDSTTVPWGRDVTFSISVTNKGSGKASDVTLKTVFSPAVVRFSSPTIVNSNTVESYLGTIEPGAVVHRSITLLPHRPGTLTSTVTVIDSGDPNSQNNVAVSTVAITPPEKGAAARFPFSPKDLDYDAVTGRIFFLDDHSLDPLPPHGFVRGQIWMIDPDVPEIYPPISFSVSGSTVSGISIGESGGDLFAHRSYGAIDRMDTQTLEITRAIEPAGAAMLDMEVSALDPRMVMLSDERGTFLYHDGTRFPNGISGSGNGEFSDIGGRLFFVSPETCDLDIYLIDENGLTLESNFGPASCSDFKVEDGLLYFNTGLILNPLESGAVPPNLNLPPPSFVLPRGGGILDVLTRTNGAWLVRRLAGESLEQMASVEIGELPGSPLELIPAGRDQVAFRTASSDFDLFLVNLEDPNALRVAISTGATQELSLSFGSADGAIYRIERSEEMPPTWTTVRDNIPGTGEPIEHQIAAPDGSSAFFRIQRLP